MKSERLCIFVPEKLKTLKIQEKMKTIYNRIFMLAMALMMSLSTFALKFYSETVEVNGIFYNIYFDETTSPYAWPIGKDNNGSFPYDYSYSGDITIPSSITYEVGYTWSGDDKYQNKKVTFPVLYINWGVFRRCSDVTSVTLPNSVIEIDKGSFENCGLSSVTIPCTAVGDGPGMFEGILPGAFKGCTNLTSVTNLSCVPQNINFAWLEEPAFEVYGDLHVLKGRKQAYQDAPIWNKFNIIDDVEITPTMVKETIDAIDNVQKVYANEPAKKLNTVKFLITNARIAFDALSKEQQALVKNINLLIEAEKAYEKLATGITDINADSNKKDGKYFENGKIVIVKNGKKFNINGLKK